jgi:hypothetical protein
MSLYQSILVGIEELATVRYANENAQRRLG